MSKTNLSVIAKFIVFNLNISTRINAVVNESKASR